MARESVTKAVESNHGHLKAQVRESMLVIDRASSPQEVEFLLNYRKANKADKQRLMKILYAAGKGLLPTVEESNAMTPEQRRAFADALPEVAVATLLPDALES